LKTFGDSSNAGTGEFIARLAQQIEDDYRRWDEFESARDWPTIRRWVSSN